MLLEYKPVAANASSTTAASIASDGAAGVTTSSTGSGVSSEGPTADLEPPEGAIEGPPAWMRLERSTMLAEAAAVSG